MKRGCPDKHSATLILFFRYGLRGTEAAAIGEVLFCSLFLIETSLMCVTRQPGSARIHPHLGIFGAHCIQGKGAEVLPVGGDA